MVVTVFMETDAISIPAWVSDLESFRRWTRDDDFPDEKRIAWLKGEVWADMSQEQIFSHAQIKTKFAIHVGGLVEREKLGMYTVDGVWLSNSVGDFCGIPDGLFVSNATVETGRVRFVEGSQGGYTEVQGSPDMVLEVVSNSSVRKDTVTLRQAYWEAEIPEYWLVDARGETVQFDILKHTARGYSATRKKEGWVKSAVFGKSFRLLAGRNLHQLPEFTLEIG